MKHREQVKIVLVKIDFRREILRHFSEKNSVLQSKFFIMLEKFHACFAEKKWLLFTVKKKNGGN